MLIVKNLTFLISLNSRGKCWSFVYRKCSMFTLWIKWCYSSIGSVNIPEHIFGCHRYFSCCYTAFWYQRTQVVRYNFGQWCYYFGHMVLQLRTVRNLPVLRPISIFTGVLLYFLFFHDIRWYWRFGKLRSESRFSLSSWSFGAACQGVWMLSIAS
jgi:hypothetical protein